MDRSEVLGILSVLKAAYPGFYRGMDRQDAENAVSLWNDIFRDDSAATVGLAVKEFISKDSKGFPPTPGQIRAKMPKNNLALCGQKSKKWAEYQRKYTDLMERRRNAGLPGGLEEARARRMTEAEYARLCDEAGLGLEVILWPDMQISPETALDVSTSGRNPGR